MERNTIDIMGIPVDNVNMQEAMEKVFSFLDADKNHMLFTPNAEIMMAAIKDKRLGDILRAADLIIPDGAGVVLASRIIGRPLKEKVSGFDLCRNLFIQQKRPLKVFLLGAKPFVAEEAASRIQEANPLIKITGTHDGYFTEQQDPEIISRINGSGAELLLVALGAPKQEMWISKYKEQLKVKVCIGVGGTIDILSGKKEAAPDFFRNNGLEWLYRLYQEPKRFGRMMALPKYILLAAFYRITKG